MNKKLTFAIVLFFFGLLIILLVYPKLKISSGCNSNSTIEMGDETRKVVNCGDKIVVDLDFNYSTGYAPFDPEYDETVFEIVEWEDIQKSSPLEPTGEPRAGVGNIRTYTFRTLKQSPSSSITMGIDRSWEPEKTRKVTKELEIVVK